MGLMIAAVMTREIGYGNAAGFLFHKGVSAPPEASIQEIPDPAPAEPDRDPITALRERMDALKNRPDPSEGPPMTDEEKEREAERLYTLFKRLEKNPVLSMQSQSPGAGGGAPTSTSTSIDQIMRDKLASGEMDEVLRREEEAERAAREREEREDEVAAAREQQELRNARGIRDWEERHGRCWDTASLSDIDDIRWGGGEEAKG
jgi:hypothetical protein